LKHQEYETRILIHQTSRGEKLYLQYPGKETERPEPKKNLLDFKPELITKDGEQIKRQSFSQIWNEIQDLTKLRIKVEAIRALATLLYRMAHMMDFEKPERDIELESTKLGFGLNSGDIWVTRKSHSPFWRYQPPEPDTRELSSVIPDVGGMSLEAFLYYNQILAWNEDCKYLGPKGMESKDFFRKGSNNLLTHVKITGLLLDDVKISDVLWNLSRFGVSPATPSECRTICRPWLDGMR
jgi:hypothetical protein